MAPNDLKMTVMLDTTATPRDVLTAAAAYLRGLKWCADVAEKIEAYRDAQHPAPKVRAELSLDGVHFEWCADGVVRTRDARYGRVANIRRADIPALAAYDATVDEHGFVTQGSGAGVSAAVPDPVVSSTGEPSAAAPPTVPASAPREFWYVVAPSGVRVGGLFGSEASAELCCAEDFYGHQGYRVVHVREVTADEEAQRDWRSIARAYLEERNDARAALASLKACIGSSGVGTR